MEALDRCSGANRIVPRRRHRSMAFCAWRDGFLCNPRNSPSNPAANSERGGSVSDGSGGIAGRHAHADRRSSGYPEFCIPVLVAPNSYAAADGYAPTAPNGYAPADNCAAPNSHARANGYSPTYPTSYGPARANGYATSDNHALANGYAASDSHASANAYATDARRHYQPRRSLRVAVLVAGRAADCVRL